MNYEIDTLPVLFDTKTSQLHKPGQGDHNDSLAKHKNAAIHTRKVINELETQMRNIQKQLYHIENPMNTTEDFKKLIKLKRDRRKFESDAQL
jgi:hypothetical protein